MRDDRIEQLIRLVEKSQISELEIQEGFGRKIRISKGLPSMPAMAPPAQQPGVVNPPGDLPVPVAGEGKSNEGEGEDSGLAKIVAPMVGTFYRASAPDAPPYVQVGTQIETGQTLCIIEAMKIMNEIASEVRGSVRKVLVENGQPVEFGQTLFLVEKSN